ncbi:MAG: hypothetical protein GC136_07085 [Alphaproteobacteria bacterium]|nr:hypothetical protein [Alphaproteobacteria bacterium]
MQKALAFIKKNPLLVLGLAVVAVIGLLNIDRLPKETVLFALGLIIFFSCAKLSWQEFKNIRLVPLISFTLLRFAAFPVAALYLLQFIVPEEYWLGVFLLLLCPAGFSLMAFSASFGGNTSLALLLTIVTSLLAPFTIPFLSDAVLDQKVQVDTITMCVQLLMVIVIPAALYIVSVRFYPQLKTWIKMNNNFYVLMLLGTIGTIALAQQFNVFANNLDFIGGAFVICALLYPVLYLVGWFFAFHDERRTKITKALASGAMNVSLAIGIALLYFPPKVTAFLIVSDLVWFAAIPVFRRVLPYLRLPNWRKYQ